MAEQPPCPRCRHANSPENRFCGWCGASLESSHELVPRREGALTAVRRALPAKLGPASRVVAVGLVTLAAEVGLSWLRHRTKAEERPLTLTARQVDAAASGHLLGESLEEVLIQELEGGHRSRVFVRRAIRSLVITQPTDRWG
jgi:Double zinc ribbon